MDGPCLEVLCFVVARNLVAELAALFWQKSHAARQPDTDTFAGTHMNTLREAYFELINHQASYGIHVRARLQQATNIVSTLQASVNARHCNAQHTDTFGTFIASAHSSLVGALCFSSAGSHNRQTTWPNSRLRKHVLLLFQPALMQVPDGRFSSGILQATFKHIEMSCVIFGTSLALAWG